MRCAFRLSVAVLVIATFLVTTLFLLQQYQPDVRAFWGGVLVRFGGPLHASPSLGTATPNHNGFGPIGDKVIVMAKMQKEDTQWVADNLPDWRHAIYTVDNTSAPLHTPANKGHESMAYLTYIIENYDSLPSILAFLHSHRGGWFHYMGSWHTDAPHFDNVASLHSLQLPFVQRSGYVNLRCASNPGCKASHTKNKHITREIWGQIFNGTEGEEMPEFIGAACCAQFAVSREQVLHRPLADYIRYRDWVLRTELDDAHSGRVMEFLWHVIFGKEAIQ
ncbi:MAG: hypothetical protein M1827_006655 [Pycnora praestabilis]|nr:MAG: hypothetical protein M1827_006655 [Pycnora praestabilis]